MDDYRYTYSVARVSVLSTKLIDASFASRALAADPNEILRMLGETAYAESFAGVQDPADIDRALVAELRKTYELLRGICPQKELIDIFRRRYDFHNVKALLKSQITGIPTNGSLMDLGTYELDKLTAAVSDKAYRFVPDYIRETAQEATAQYERTRKLSAISYSCDRMMWGRLLEEASRAGNQVVLHLITQYVDFANMKAFVRVKEFAEDREMLNNSYIPGGNYSLEFFQRYMDEQLGLFLSHIDKNSGERKVLTEGLRMWPEDKSFWRLEVAIDNYILNRFYQARMALFSIAPLLYYLLKKEADAKFIRIVIKSKMIGMTRAEIEERVRFLYV
jgi:V/A-type H+-transporting ATPase subunit C